MGRVRSGRRLVFARIVFFAVSWAALWFVVGAIIDSRGVAGCVWSDLIVTILLSIFSLSSAADLVGEGDVWRFDMSSGSSGRRLGVSIGLLLKSGCTVDGLNTIQFLSSPFQRSTVVVITAVGIANMALASRLQISLGILCCSCVLFLPMRSIRKWLFRQRQVLKPTGPHVLLVPAIARKLSIANWSLPKIEAQGKASIDCLKEFSNPFP